MAFTRVNPAGWAVSDKLTSAQINTLDTDHAGALDKRSGQTDTLLSSVTVSGAGQITANSSAAILSSVANGITSNVVGGIQAAVAAGIQSTAAGGIQLAGGTLDWPTFQFARSYSQIVPPVLVYYLGTLPQQTSILTALGSGASYTFSFRPHHGATINTVTMVFAVGQGHAQVPVGLPSLIVYRGQDLTTTGVAVASETAASLRAAGAAVLVPAPNTAAGYFASGNVQPLVFTADQNAVVDRAKFQYFITVQDENGTGSLSGNKFLGFIVNYSAIPNMQFP